jgi:hypothetical protein
MAEFGLVVLGQSTLHEARPRDGDLDPFCSASSVRIGLLPFSRSGLGVSKPSGFWVFCVLLPWLVRSWIGFPVGLLPRVVFSSLLKNPLATAMA